MNVRTLALASGLLLGALGAFPQSGETLKSGETLTGTVSDAMCGAKHMMTNVTPAQCTRECVKQGSDYALVSGGKVYTLKGDKKLLDKYAGQNVTVTGTISGTTVSVSSVSPAKS
jgi:hypothetical protein